MARRGRNFGLVALSLCWAGCLHVAADEGGAPPPWGAPCEAGKYLDTATLACVVCPAGKFSPEAGAVGCCIDCFPGTFALDEAQTSCTLCDAGKYSVDGSSGNVDHTKCELCTPGKFLPVQGVGPWPEIGLLGEAYRPYYFIDPPHGVSCGGGVDAKSCAHCPVTQCAGDCATVTSTDNYTNFETNSTYTNTTIACRPHSWIEPKVRFCMRKPCMILAEHARGLFNRCDIVCRLALHAAFATPENIRTRVLRNATTVSRHITRRFRAQAPPASHAEPTLCRLPEASPRRHACVRPSTMAASIPLIPTLQITQ
jgi:hypothetical protein